MDAAEPQNKKNKVSQDGACRPLPADRLLSPLTRRILAVNILPLAVLAVGLLFLDEYRDNLIESKLNAMHVQAEMMAAALGENAAFPRVKPGTQPQRPRLHANALHILRRLSASSHVRGRLFGPDGALVADTRQLSGPGGIVHVVELPAPEPADGLIGDFLDAFDWVAKRLPWYEAPPTYGEERVQRASHYAETSSALEGAHAYGVRAFGAERLILTIAVPVQHYKHVMGALMLSKDSRNIDAAIYEVRLDILKAFGGALGLTVLLSMYLASTIARPIKRLAQAAERVRRSHRRSDALPDFGGREDEITELADAMRDMTDALWGRMDAIESFAADVAHEIKNPLTSLQSAVETVNRIDDPDQKERLMAIIADDVRRLDRLISDISDASRLDAELSRAVAEPVDVAAMLVTLADMHAATTSDGPKLRLDVADSGLVVQGLEGRLVQVFRNLIGNAVTFSPPDGFITIAAGLEGRHVVVTVDDLGPGIPAGKENDIFQRFYSERPSSEKFGTHSGLGLSISRQIVDAMGGSLLAENLVGAGGRVLGARFTVRLPKD